MKKKFTFLIAAALMLLTILFGSPNNVMGQTRSTKTEGFESSETDTNYQSTFTVDEDHSDCGIRWSFNYGCVSTSSAINGSKSAALRLYKTGDFGHLQTTTAINGLTNVAYTAKAATSNSATILIDVFYSNDGSTWTSIATDQSVAESATDYDWDIPSGGKYFKIAISSNSTRPSKSGTQLTIDDVVFTYTTSSTPSISVNPTSENVTCASGSAEFTITPSNIANPSYTLQFYAAASGSTTAEKPSWINTPSFDGNTLTLTYGANTGDERYAYFTVKSGEVESEQRVTLTQAEYTVTPPTITAAATSFDANMDVTITPASGNATVYYTTDNTTPSNTNGTAITSATVINLKATTTVKAIGYDANSVASTVTSATYTKSTKNISEITSAGSYSVVGTVVATHNKGFVIGDGTGYVYYYSNSYSSGSVAINNKIKFSSKSISAYAHVLEFNNQSYSNNQASSNYEALPVTTLNASGIAAYMSGNHLSDYVQIEGTASVSTTDNTYDINVSGATYNVRLAYPTDAQKSALSALHGKKVRVKGYYTGFNNNTDANATHFTIMLESVEDINPVVAASGNLNEFTYGYGSGPSAAQSVNISGNHLTANITVSASSNYEVCLTSDGTYTSSVTLTQSAGSVSSTPVYIRLKSGLNSGTYSTNSDKITVSSTGATDVTVALSGSVTHAIDYETPNNGTLSGNTAAAYGTTVTITAEPASGYKLDSWNITQTTGGASTGINPEIASGNDYTITMPDFDITVNATFVPAYTITINNTTSEWGSVYTTPTSAGEGEEITITVTPNSGYDLNTMNVVNNTTTQSITVTNNKFNMPASNVTITVSFIATYTVTYDKNGASVTGTAPVDALSPYHSGATVTVLGKGNLAWEGHTFEWWSDHEDWETVGAEVYAPGETFDISENTTLYAQWSTNTYAYTLSLTGQDGAAMAELYDGETEIGENDEIEYGTEVTVVVACGNSYAYAIKVKNNSTGAYLTVTNDKFTMPASAVTVTVVTDLVATLTGTNMNNVSNYGTPYGTGENNLKTITVNGFYWEANAYQTGTNCGYLQINTNGTGNPSGSYIKLPVFPGKIERINFDVESASGGNTSNVLYINTIIGNGSSSMPHSESTSSKTRTIDMTNVFYNTGYIVSAGSTRIKSISVKYRPYQDMAGGTITTIEPDVTVSIPEDASVSAYNLTIPASSGLTIKSGATLTVNGTFTNSGNSNNLIIEDGGQLKFTSTGAKADVKATVQKNITGYTNDNTGWNFIASPIDGSISPDDVTNLLGEQIQTTPTVLYNYDLYRFNPAEPENKGWENYHQHNDNSDPFMLVNGQGYLYAKNSNTTLSFAGTIKPYTTDAGANEVDLSAGWNLVGNPYTFNVYSSKSFYEITTVDGKNVVTAATNVPIAPCTGIVVKSAAGSESVAFNETAGEWSNGNHGNIQMTLAQTVATRGSEIMETIDNAIVSFNEGSELPKFYFGTQNANIYIPLDNEEYAIVSSNAQGEMPVNFKASQDGQYTITVNSEGVEVGYLHLIDNIAGKDIDLLATPSYTFNAKGDDYESRFRLVFSANMTNAEMGEEFAFISDGQLVIANVGEAILHVIDVTGRVVAIENINGTCSKAINAKAGVYVLRLINGTDVKTQKMVIR